MKKQLLLLVLMALPLMVSAHDIEVQNSDGVPIYYNYTNDGTELSVTHSGSLYNSYSGRVVIPEEVTYQNATRNVTSIGYAAFAYSDDLTSVTIPESVTSIYSFAFSKCTDLGAINIPKGVKTIGEKAFEDCIGLKKVIVPDIAAWCGIKFVKSYANPLYYAKHLYSDDNKEIKDLVIPKGVTSISSYAFYGCTGIYSIVIPSSVTSIDYATFSGCSGLTSVTIPSSVTTIEGSAFEGCSSLTSLNIPNSVTSIGSFAFYYCSSLNTVTIPNSVTSIGSYAFYHCTSLTTITIGKSVASIGKRAFDGTDPSKIISLIEFPFEIKGMAAENYDRIFALQTFFNATLYVPQGAVDRYKATEGWKDFTSIAETGSIPIPEKCEKPTISYKNGKLTYHCDTEGATFQTTITNDDIKSYTGNEVQLSVTYNIYVYAAKDGYKNSDVASAILCWIEADPDSEGLTNGIAQIPSKSVMIQSEDGFLRVEGVDDGTPVSVYTLDGKQVASIISRNGAALLGTNIQPGTAIIVKVCGKSVKMIMK